MNNIHERCHADAEEPCWCDEIDDLEQDCPQCGKPLFKKIGFLYRRLQCSDCPWECIIGLSP